MQFADRQGRLVWPIDGPLGQQHKLFAVQRDRVVGLRRIHSFSYCSVRQRTILKRFGCEHARLHPLDQQREAEGCGALAIQKPDRAGCHALQGDGQPALLELALQHFAVRLGQQQIAGIILAKDS